MTIKVSLKKKKKEKLKWGVISHHCMQWIGSYAYVMRASSDKIWHLIRSMKLLQKRTLLLLDCCGTAERGVGEGGAAAGEGRR